MLEVLCSIDSPVRTSPNGIELSVLGDISKLCCGLNLAAMVMLTSLALMSSTQPLFNSSLGSLLLALSSTVHPTSTTSLLVLVDHHWLLVHLLLLVVILLLPVVDQLVDLVVDLVDQV